MKLAENEIKSLFSTIELSCEKIPKSNFKTPDFKVYKENRQVALCEVKAVEYCSFLNQANKNNSQAFIFGGKDSTFNRLSDDMKKAAKQFKSYDPNHQFPRILTFVNYETSCDIEDFESTYTGNFYATDGSIHPIYKKISEGRISDLKKEIDVYIWLNRPSELIVTTRKIDRTPYVRWVTPRKELPELSNRLSLLHQKSSM